MIWVLFTIGVSGYLSSPVLLYTTGDTALLPVILGVSLAACVLAWLLIRQKQSIEA